MTFFHVAVLCTAYILLRCIILCSLVLQKNCANGQNGGGGSFHFAIELIFNEPLGQFICTTKTAYYLIGPLPPAGQ